MIMPVLLVMAFEAAHPGLFDAIVQVESGGDVEAVGDGGQAVGCAQIHPVLVEDVNRILRKETFTLEDRKSYHKSRLMFMVYSSHYADYYDDWTVEGIARRWNGGPTGHTKEATEAYADKVQAHL